MLRPKGTVTPCGICPKVPATAPFKARRFAFEWSDRHRRAYEHYLECRAVGWHVPEASDPVVRRNARIFRQVEDEAERMPNLRLLSVLSLIARKG